MSGACPVHHHMAECKYQMSAIPATNTTRSLAHWALEHHGGRRSCEITSTPAAPSCECCPAAGFDGTAGEGEKGLGGGGRRGQAGAVCALDALHAPVQGREALVQTRTRSTPCPPGLARSLSILKPVPGAHNRTRHAPGALGEAYTTCSWTPRHSCGPPASSPRVSAGARAA